MRCLLEVERARETLPEVALQSFCRHVAVLWALDPVFTLGGETLLAEVLEKVNLVHEGGVGDGG